MKRDMECYSDLAWFPDRTQRPNVFLSWLDPEKDEAERQQPSPPSQWLHTHRWGPQRRRKLSETSFSWIKAQFCLRDLWDDMDGVYTHSCSEITSAHLQSSISLLCVCVCVCGSSVSFANIERHGCSWCPALLGFNEVWTPQDHHNAPGEESACVCKNVFLWFSAL